MIFEKCELTNIFEPKHEELVGSWRNIAQWAELFIYFLSFLFWPFLPTYCRCRGLLLHCNTLNYTLTHTHTHTLNLTHTHTHTHSITYTHSITHTHTLTHTHTQSHTHTLNHAQTHSITYTHNHTHPISHTHTHTHTHKLSITHTHTHTIGLLWTSDGPSADNPTWNTQPSQRTDIHASGRDSNLQSQQARGRRTTP
jgi:hypothetical protein